MPVVIGPINKTGPIVQFYLLADILSQSAVTNQTVVRITRQAWNTGNSGSNFSGPGTQTSVWFNGGGYVLAGQHVANPFLPSGVPGGTLRWSEFEDVVLTHDANGYWLGGTSMSLRMDLSYGSVAETHYGSLTIPRIARVPLAPASPFVSPGSVTTTSFALGFSAADGRGAAVDLYEVEWATDAGFTVTVATEQSASGPIDSGSVLAPGTGHYAHVRAHNSVGWGAWSTIVSQSTLPAAPPTSIVTPSLNGQSASVALSPPGGATGVTFYRVQYRLNGTTTILDTIDTATSPLVVPGLTPGAVYDWRASAFFGSYESPVSDWTPVAQPNPNTNPGDYFDGSFAPTPDLTFDWVGADNNSISQAFGREVVGWKEFGDGDGVSGGSGVVYQATQDYFGEFAARVSFFTDTTAAGFISGNNLLGGFAVEASAAYQASAHLWLPRSQRMQIGVEAYDAADVYLYTSWGDQVVVPASAGAPTRLSMPFVPVEDGRGAVVVRNVAGTGHSLWLAGESYIMDANMASLGTLYPYFDGDTTDSDEYVYAWEGDPNESVSSRTDNPDAPFIDPLADPDCPPLPAPPLPPTIASDCIDEVGIWRRYTVSIPASEVHRWTATLPTLVLTTGASDERQVRIRSYPNPDGLAPDQIDLTSWESEIILSFIPANTVMTVDGVTQRVWAEVNGGAPLPANKLLFGTGNVPATWPEFRCGDGYVVTFDVPLDAPAGNLETAVTLTMRM